MDAAPRAEEAASLEKPLYGATGPRYTDADGVVHERLCAITLARTILFALLATLPSLVVCSPIAYNLASASSARNSVRLLVAMIIPWAISAPRNGGCTGG
jgi:ABC-type spermidine/putrescine transport system permease subunit I